MLHEPQVASFSARISALRVALNFTALDAISSRSETAVDEFSSVLQQLLTVWEDIKVRLKGTNPIMPGLQA